MAQISMDGSATDVKFFESLKAYSSQSDLPKLMNISSCGLHIIHGAFKSGTEAASWQLKATLKSVLHLLHDSPAQRGDFTSPTRSNEFRLLFHAT